MTFHSGFIDWIRRRLLAGDDSDDLVEVIGYLARTQGLPHDVADLVAAMTGTTIAEVVAAYRADNTAWTGTQAIFDRPELAALEEHLTAIAHCHQPDPAPSHREHEATDYRMAAGRVNEWITLWPSS